MSQPNANAGAEHTTMRVTFDLMLDPAVANVEELSGHFRSLTQGIGEVAGVTSVRVEFNSGEAVDPKLLLSTLDFITDATTGRAAQHTRQVCRLLDGESLTTLRDVLLAGEDSVSNIDRMGPPGVETIRTAIQNVDPSLKWGFWPSPETAAQLYTSIDEIPLVALRKRAKPGMQVVGSVLDMETEELARLLSGRSEPYVSDIRDAAKLQTTARDFARQFHAARARRR